MSKYLFAVSAALVAACSAWGVYGYVGQWGEEGPGNGQFQQPVALAVADDGKVYVADAGNYRVQYFNPVGQYLGQWQVQEPGPAFPPGGIDVAPSASYCGAVYTTESGGARVAYFTPVGRYRGGWGSSGTGNGEFDHTEGVEVAFNYVYVADANNHRIQYFTPSGDYVGQWGSSGSGNGQFSFPTDVAVGPDRRVYVTDYSNHRVQYFTPTGSYLGKWGSEGSGEGQFNCPRSVAVDYRGRLRRRFSQPPGAVLYRDRELPRRVGLVRNGRRRVR